MTQTSITQILVIKARDVTIAVGVSCPINVQIRSKVLCLLNGCYFLKLIVSVSGTEVSPITARAKGTKTVKCDLVQDARRPVDY